MYIGQACEETGLSKKAILYYEKEDLVNPKTMENGYRIFSKEEVNKLKEIRLLRIMDVPVNGIKDILNDKDSMSKKNKLLAHRSNLIMEQNQLNKKIEALDNIVYNYSEFANSYEEIILDMTAKYNIQRKLVEQFPDGLGLFLSNHFGSFLDISIESKEQEDAYKNIVKWLDNIKDIAFSDDIMEMIQNFHSEYDTNNSFVAIDNIEEYMKDNKEIIKNIEKYYLSEEYKQSTTYKFKQIMIQFQKESGYIDVFLKNMKKLSPKYKEYSVKLKLANDKYLRENHRMEQLYKHNDFNKT